MTAPRLIVAGEIGEQALIVDTLAHAFLADPACCWIIRREHQRLERLHSMFDIMVPDDLASGMILRSPDNEVATLWRRPGQAHTSKMKLLSLAVPLIRTFGSALGRALSVADAIDSHHPKGFDYWYLHYAGVRPESQGKGWGGIAIRAGINMARQQGKPVYLETATASNVGLYQRLGFTVIKEWDVPGGGPHFWSMLAQ